MEINSVLNPFFLPIGGSSYQNVENYHNIYILCLSNKYGQRDAERVKKFHDANATMDELIKCSKLVSLIKAPVIVTKNKSIQSGLVTVDGKHLSCLDAINVFQQQELVYLMLESNMSQVVHWLNMYTDRQISVFIRDKAFMSYYELDDIHVASTLIKCINNCTSYWEEHYISDRDVKREEIEELLINDSYLTEREKYYLLCNLLISKTNIYHVISNEKVLVSNKKVFEKYKPVFRYLLGYTWLAAGHNECVIDIHAASQLPTFPFNHLNPLLNPYFTTNKPIKHYVASVTQTVEPNIVTLSEFTQRLNYFMTGNIGLNIFDKVDWRHMVLTGSIMAAILPRFNFLMESFDNENEFFDEYYTDTHVTLLCDHTNMVDYIDHVKNFKQIVNENISDKLKWTSNKTVKIYVKSSILRERCEKKKIPYTYDYIIDNRDKHQIQFYFYELYLEQKKTHNKKVIEMLQDKINDDDYCDIINYADFKKVTLIITDVIDIDKDSYYLHDETEVFIKFTETLRYYLSSSVLKRDIVISRVHDDIIPTIKRFTPCKRSYYDGKTCYLLPTAISAYLTLTNIGVDKFTVSNSSHPLVRSSAERLYHCGYGYVTVNPPATTVPDNYAKNDILSDHLARYPKYHAHLVMPSIDDNGVVMPFKRWMIDIGYDLLHE